MNPPSPNLQQPGSEAAGAQASIRLDRLLTEFRRMRPVWWARCGLPVPRWTVCCN
ncbi:MAG: hypothetical protein HY855_13190 [Burkholderiales bacterium]|nr:hypothetical protein [Burkholderiales bacterium]